MTKNIGYKDAEVLQTLVSALDIHVYSSYTEFNEQKHFKHFCIVCVLNTVLSFESEDEILKFFRSG